QFGGLKKQKWWENGNSHNKPKQARKSVKEHSTRQTRGKSNESK
ncbi:2414_t:CDS:2, partial [Racocetra persica]